MSMFGEIGLQRPDTTPTKQDMLNYYMKDALQDYFKWRRSGDEYNANKQQSFGNFGDLNDWANRIAQYYDTSAQSAADFYQNRMNRTAGSAGEEMARRARRQGVWGMGPQNEWGKDYSSKIGESAQDALSNIYAQSGNAKANAIASLAQLLMQYNLKNQLSGNNIDDVFSNVLRTGAGFYSGYGGSPNKLGNMSGYGSDIGVDMKYKPENPYQNYGTGTYMAATQGMYKR